MKEVHEIYDKDVNLNDDHDGIVAGVVISKLFSNNDTLEAIHKIIPQEWEPLDDDTSKRGLVTSWLWEQLTN